MKMSKFLVSTFMFMVMCLSSAFALPVSNTVDTNIDGVWTEKLSSPKCGAVTITTDSYFHTNGGIFYDTDLPFGTGAFQSTNKISHVLFDGDPILNHIDSMLSDSCENKVPYEATILAATVYITKRTISIVKTTGIVTIMVNGSWYWDDATGRHYTTFKYKGVLKGAVTYP